MKAIASHNGLAAAGHALEHLRGGNSPLDACVEGVTLVEDDPEELTVGYGGLPNEDGVVQLDAAVMDGQSHRGGGVAALEGIRHPTRVARLVMERTNRVLLAGEGAKLFALANGFREENLLTDRAREMWLYWKRTRGGPEDWRPPAAGEVDLDLEAWFQRHFYGRAAREGARLGSLPPEPAGTVHLSVLDSSGNLAAATSTSGHAFKLAGRVGDSPILGAGLYVDNGVGACGSIGHGEANLENLSSFSAVEAMRRGATPEEAGLETLRRVAEKSHPQQLDESGRATFNLQLFLLAKSGEAAGVAMWGPKQFAVADESGIRLEECRALWER